MKLRFGSVCSGIEAASMAWNPLGWEAAWLSEIDAFPCAVLAHHFPDVPNLGDMTTLPERILSGEVEAPDILCGGTPCQAFSFAGRRQSLDDERGNLSLIFCEIANAIDSIRSVRGLPPTIIFWENVPGVLSTKDNAFGCFLAGLAGGDAPYQVPEGKWGGVALCSKGSVRLPGASSTLNISECLNDVVESTLSQVLEKGLVHPRFFLSARACQGILRRAERRGKQLPLLLKAALEVSIVRQSQELSRQVAELSGGVRKPCA